MPAEDELIVPEELIKKLRFVNMELLRIRLMNEDIENFQNIRNHTEALRTSIESSIRKDSDYSLEDHRKIIAIGIATRDLLIAAGYDFTPVEGNPDLYTRKVDSFDTQLREYRQMATDAQVSPYASWQKIGIAMMAIAAAIVCISLCVGMPLPAVVGCLVGLLGLGLFALNQKKGISQGLSQKMTHVADNLEQELRIE